MGKRSALTVPVSGQHLKPLLQQCRDLESRGFECIKGITKITDHYINNDKTYYKALYRREAI